MLVFFVDLILLFFAYSFLGWCIEVTLTTSLFAAVCPTQKQPEKRSTFQVRAMDELVLDIELKHVFIKFAGALKAIYRIGITSMLQYCSYFFFGERRT